MFSFLKSESANLIDAKRLADILSEAHNRTVYVVHLCDDDYEVTSQVPLRFEYKTCQE